MDSLVPNFGQVGQRGIGQIPGQNHDCQHGIRHQVTYEELDRPAKELTLEVLYQLSLKLQNTSRGNWASLAEIMGYSRDKIDEFDHQSTAEYKPPGYLVLRDWTKQERGRSLYVLLESLKQCGRFDCVAFLEQEIKNLLSMKLHLKITDETVNPDAVKPYFLTVPTRCQATLKDSLENVFGGELQDYEICASWTDRAHQFKGMHLSVRRQRRSNIGSSLTSYQECTHFRCQGQQNNLSDPNNLLTGHRNHQITCQEKSITSKERNVSPDQLNVSPENHTFSRNGQSISVGDEKRRLENCPGHKDYVSEECMYCGKFRTFTQKIVHSQADKEHNNIIGRKIESGLHCRSCTCDISVIGGVSLSGRERQLLTTQRTDISCDVTRTERGCDVSSRKLSDGSNNENVVSSTTDMDVDVKQIDDRPETYKMSSETSGYKSFPNVSSNSGHLDGYYDDDILNETFVKSPFHTQAVVRVVTEDITIENDTENVTELHPHVMTRSISDTTSSYQRLNRETMTYKETNMSRFRFDAVQVMHGPNLGTVGDMFCRQHKSPIEHSEEVFKNTNHEMSPHLQIQGNGRENIVPQNGSGNIVPQSGSDNTVTQWGSGNIVTQSGSGNIVPQSGSDNTVPQWGNGNIVPQSGSGNVVLQSGSGNIVPQNYRENIVPQCGRENCMTESVRDNILPSRNNLPETHEMVNLGNDVLPKSTQKQAVPALPARKVDRCQQISSTREDKPPTLPPRNRPAPYPSSRSSAVDSKFVHLNKELQRYPEWHPKEHENTVENKMSRYLNSDGHYLLWYMTSKKTLVLSVSHLRKLIHYAIYVAQENGQLSYFIFKGETFTDLHMLLYYYKHAGLKPQSLQARHSNDFLQQQNLRGSRQIARLSHVQLLYPVNSSRGRSSV
ncbi:uncharacterized protein LOC110458959 [Mizuhopecten yessoensis]|uniref:Death domain-containing protein n=1 Tax=Mizuhopecten yessoensis TaxID=6573 RepID=A0A210Q5N8_MIZYE|nr:uncharacterized protein LOC110458959 [Mizuhopecten yessoensis]OWF43999.1 hypothetical protein KP79_PYT11676 [Mizuhopecten yessoensis]